MLEDLSTYRENNRLEAKAAQGGLPRSLWETYSAFANSSGGIILLGAEEEADKSLRAVGVRNADKLLDDFWNTINNPQKVSENILTDADIAVITVGGARLIQIHVPRADRRVRPIYLNDNPKRAFRRNHSGDYLCRYEEIQGMMRDAADESQDSKPLVRVQVSELDSSTISAYRQRYLLSHDGHAWNELDDNEFLRCIGAAAEAEDECLHPTVAGLLMFGHDWRINEELPNYFLDYRQQISATERWQDRVVSQGGDWTGNLYDFYFRVYNLMKQAFKTPFKLEGISRVDDTPAHKALREALANCLTNASFTERRGVVCLWTQDALILENPGDFRVDMQQALRGGKSDPRNATLLKIFSLVDIGERAGSGIPSIVRNWTASGYAQPYWEESFGPDRTRLVLPLVTPFPESAAKSGGKKRRQKAVAIDEITGNSFAEEGKRKERTIKIGGKKRRQKAAARGKTARGKQMILMFAFQRESVVISDVMAALGLGKTRSRELLRELVNEGYLVVEGRSRATRYRLSDAAQREGGRYHG